MEDAEKVSAAQKRPAYRPMSRDIAANLRQAILEGRIEPGERIRQESIAEASGVSRIPVREALRQLENEGLITHVPHAGARVSRHDPQEMLELYLLRESLEPLLLSHSVVNLTDTQLGELHESMDRVRAVETDVQTWLLEDRCLISVRFRRRACRRRWPWSSVSITRPSHTGEISSGRWTGRRSRSCISSIA